MPWTVHSTPPSASNIRDHRLANRCCAQPDRSHIEEISEIVAITTVVITISGVAIRTARSFHTGSLNLVSEIDALNPYYHRAASCKLSDERTGRRVERMAVVRGEPPDRRMRMKIPITLLLACAVA